jgi:glycosyltransferase involved in cell wall biosynthesis
MLLVKEKLTDDGAVVTFEGPVRTRVSRVRRIVEAKLDFVGNYVLPQNYWSSTESRFLRKVQEISPDVINLHAIHGHRRHFPYKAMRTLSSSAKLVWTLHDMWAFTGHCSYSYDCERWRSKCSSCPYPRIFVPLILDTTPMSFTAKQKIYRETDFVVVCPSRWLHDLAVESALLRDKRVVCIPYGVDTNVFFPRDKLQARHWLGIPEDHRVVLGVSHDFRDPRKGLKYVQETLHSVRAEIGPTTVVLLGHGNASSQISEEYPVRSLGYVSDPWLLATVYSAADILLFPTLADNLPNVVLEAMACGTPVVSFDIGGLSDLVDHQETGFLAKYRDTADLANGMLGIFRDESFLAAASRKAVSKVKGHFDYERQALRYLELYATL